VANHVSHRLMKHAVIKLIWLQHNQQAASAASWLSHVA